MTKVVEGEFKKIKDIKVEDDSLACDSPLEVFNCEVSRLSKTDDDLFTYEVEIANILCDLRVDDHSEHKADDMGFDTGDDKLELTNEEFSDNEYEITEAFRIDTNIFDYETPICSAFNEFNYLLKVYPDLLTKDIMGFKTYDDYKDDWIYEWNKDVPWVDEKPWTDTGNGGNLPGTFIIENQLHYQDYEWYKALEDGELKDEALRNKAFREGSIKDDDDEEELCEVHKPLVCTIQRFEMINYSFGQGEQYVAIKEDEYDNLARTSNNACHAYQEIFRMMDEGWMVTRAE
ncbi:hypothetical protein Tco_0382444 [Tanacetum coccineum]